MTEEQHIQLDERLKFIEDTSKKQVLLKLKILIERIEKEKQKRGKVLFI